jgi:hypothetical protein
MKEFFGWVQASKMASVYVHLSGRDIDGAILKVYGMKTEDEGEEAGELKPKSCPRCKETNPATNRFCHKCGMVLDREIAMKVIKREMSRREADRILDRLMEDEEFREVLFRKIKDLSVAQK